MLKNNELEKLTAIQVIEWCYKNFEHKTVKLSTSFGADGMALIHMLYTQVSNPSIFTIDTGRNFQETYNVWQEIIEKYRIKIETFYPSAEDLSTLISENGPDLFYKSVTARKRCCYVRKVKPLKKALADAQVWITGVRREQSSSRSNMPIISYIKEHDVYKVCPLINWTDRNVWEYVRNNDIPYNKLHDKGYHTIGCQPCTRPIRPAEDIRSGRWWWEDDSSKECGIHVDDGKVVRLKENLNWNI